MDFSIDIEPTNRCNAKCSFCPRDQTPHQGLMTPETFDRALERAIEYRPIARERADWGTIINFCGLGEPLLNKHLASWIARTTAEGFRTGFSSNGALLDERRAEALLAAGARSAYINIGDIDDTYEAVYQVPFEKTRDNIVRFAEMAAGTCEVTIVLVDYRRDPAHLAAMREYWGRYGIQSFSQIEIINRGGALFVDHLEFGSTEELRAAQGRLAASARPAACGAPFAYIFIGYDGHYYLCCSDWKKEVPFGHVADQAILDLTEDKLRHVVQRAKVCDTCNLDPTNRLAEELRAEAAGHVPAGSADAVAAQIAADDEIVYSTLELLAPGVAERALAAPRRRIPVVAT